MDWALVKFLRQAVASPVLRRRRHDDQRPRMISLDPVELGGVTDEHDSP
jgi:hypothetical protein